METNATSPSILSFNWRKLTSPLSLTLIIITSAPIEVREFEASRTHLCSVEAIIIFFRLWFLNLYKKEPLIAKLLDSVAPDVKIISSGSEPIALAIFFDHFL